jgi:hypothetical protein
VLKAVSSKGGGSKIAAYSLENLNGCLSEVACHIRTSPLQAARIGLVSQLNFCVGEGRLFLLSQNLAIASDEFIGLVRPSLSMLTLMLSRHLKRNRV